jgi:hypothetical protein
MPAELAASENDLGIQPPRWLIERLLEAESAIRYQMSSARFPMHFKPSWGSCLLNRFKRELL